MGSLEVASGGAVAVAHPASCLGRLQGLRTLNGPVKRRLRVLIAPKRNLEPTLVNGTGPLVEGCLSVHEISLDTNTSQSILTTASRQRLLRPSAFYDFTALSSQNPEQEFCLPAPSHKRHRLLFPLAAAVRAQPSDFNVINNQR
jgi:hypothetical protein